MPGQGGRKPGAQVPSAPGAAGLAARELASLLIHEVLGRGRALDEAGASAAAQRLAAALDPRDLAFARLIALTVLRHRGELAAVLARCLERWPKEALLEALLLSGAAQLLLLGTPPHAAISLSVDLARRHGATRRFDKLVNAVLRRLDREGGAARAALDPVASCIPPWLWARWRAAYGDDLARAIAAASLVEAPLDVTVRADPHAWAQRLGAEVLPTGTLRLAERGRVDAMPGFAEGAWWVQDAAAALPARLVGAASGMRVADLCAAPGGKSLQLAAAGADVTAVDVSPERLALVADNLARTGLKATLVAADVRAWRPPAVFDAVLLDAPCTATGTIRRHPDILHLKRPGDVAALAALQAELIESAVALVRPGGILVFCTCSLEPEEGIEHARRLAARPDLEVIPITAAELGLEPQSVTAEGWLRTLPCHLQRATPAASGLDGFFAARWRRRA